MSILIKEHNQHRLQSPEVLGHCLSTGFVHLLSIVSGEVWSITYPSESVCGFEGSYVSIFCFSTHPFDHCYWRRKDFEDSPDLTDDPNYKGRISINLKPKQDRCHLEISSLTALDAGRYYCSIITNINQKRIGQPGVFLHVKGIKGNKISSCFSKIPILCVCLLLVVYWMYWMNVYIHVLANAILLVELCMFGAFPSYFYPAFIYTISWRAFIKAC